jgi:hypothetical protein
MLNSVSRHIHEALAAPLLSSHSSILVLMYRERRSRRYALTGVCVLRAGYTQEITENLSYRVFLAIQQDAIPVIIWALNIGQAVVLSMNIVMPYLAPYEACGGKIWKNFEESNRGLHMIQRLVLEDWAIRYDLISTRSFAHITWRRISLTFVRSMFWGIGLHDLSINQDKTRLSSCNVDSIVDVTLQAVGNSQRCGECRKAGKAEKAATINQPRVWLSMAERHDIQDMLSK